MVTVGVNLSFHTTPLSLVVLVFFAKFISLINIYEIGI